MKFVLDTDTLIYFFKGHTNIVERITNVHKNDITTTIINHAELLFGAFHSAKKQQNIEKIQALFAKIHILPFCHESSYIFAEHKALLKKQGNMLDDMDLIIASIALRNQSILVTNNMKHFNRIKNLQIENWHA